MNRFRSPWLLVFAIFGVFVFFNPFEATAGAPQEAGTAPVTVMNTPLPVTVETFGEGATAPVVVTNTEPLPVIVTNASPGEPTRESITLVLKDQYATFAAGEILALKPGVIESVFAYCGGNVTVRMCLSTFVPLTATCTNMAGNTYCQDIQDYWVEFSRTLPRMVFEIPTTGRVYVSISHLTGDPALSCLVVLVLRNNP